MHETSIAYDAIQIIKESCSNVYKVDKVFMKIGEFTCVDESSLRFAFDSLSKGSICENSILEIEKVKAMARCDLCQENFDIDFTHKLCPKCNNYSNKIVSGYELLVYEIEINDM